MSEPILDHAERGIARLTQKLKEKTRVRAWLSALLSEVQALEDAIVQTQAGLKLDNAVGAQLDKWGRRLNQGRGGLDDDAYRERLRVRLAVNRSSGTVPELLHILTLLVEGREHHAIEYFPMGLELRVTGDAVPAGPSSEWVRLFTEARMGAVYVTLHWNITSEATTLHLNSSTAGQRLNEGNIGAASVV